MLRESDAWQYCGNKKDWYTFIPGSKNESFWGPEPPIGAPKVGHAMVIDDDPDGVWWKAGVLGRSGVDVSCVHGPNAEAHAIELAEILSQGNSPPDLIIVDYNMPGKHGLDVVHDLRKILPSCRAVCVTATRSGDLDGGGPESKSTRQQATELGVPIGSLTKFALKPISTLRDLIMESVLMVSALEGPKEPAVVT